MRERATEKEEENEKEIDERASSFSFLRSEVGASFFFPFVFVDLRLSPTFPSLSRDQNRRALFFLLVLQKQFNIENKKTERKQYHRSWARREKKTVTPSSSSQRRRPPR